MEKITKLGDRLHRRLEACTVYYCSDLNAAHAYSFHSPNKWLNNSNTFNDKSSSYFTYKDNFWGYAIKKKKIYMLPP